jgi:uncharacterized protein (TIGR02246 family)
MRTSMIVFAALVGVGCATKSANRTDSTAPAAATVASTTNPADVKRFLDSAQVRYIDAVAKGDVAAISSLYTDDTEVMSPNAKAVHGRAAMDKANTQMFASLKTTALKLATEDVQTSGDLAVETGAYDQTVTPKTGKAVHDVGKYLLVWKKQPDGGWKVLREIYNTDLPAPKM